VRTASIIVAMLEAICTVGVTQEEVEQEYWEEEDSETG
jgi:hypothetical protein